MPFDPEDQSEDPYPGQGDSSADESVESSATRVRFWCPGCDEEVQVSPETVGQLVRCPYCNQDFFASDEHSHDAVVDDTTAATPERDDEINSLRVRRLSTERRSIIRIGTWWTTGLLFAGSVTIALTIKTVETVYVDRRWGTWPTVYMAWVAGAVWLGRRCRRGILNIRLELSRQVQIDPVAPPDFSSLSNGDQRMRIWDHIR